ncbi:MAG: N-(5'-phosphoribosyl)anthranilate isomerase, partial [Rhodobacteraceae bacterium]|nr:N-(5'-phosphoribosyl)anthranilate isomerase [Paracoccaceae bacterium]
MIKVKFCGLNSSAAVQAAARAGAAYVGFVFFSKSPRHLSIAKARALAQETPAGIVKVALTVDATDTFLDQLTENVP